MYSQDYPYPEVGDTNVPTLSISLEVPALLDHFLPPTSEYPLSEEVHAYEDFNAYRASGPSHSAVWLDPLPTADNAGIGFPIPLLQVGNDNPPSPQAPPSQLPQRPPSARYSGKSRSKPKCNRATPSFCDVEKRWYCSACITFFRDNYECVRHIENVGKRAKCLPCGKTVCARKDNRKRHYTMYCKRKDLGKNMGLRLEDAFEDVT